MRRRTWSSEKAPFSGPPMSHWSISTASAAEMYLGMLGAALTNADLIELSNEAMTDAAATARADGSDGCEEKSGRDTQIVRRKLLRALRAYSEVRGQREGQRRLKSQVGPDENPRVPLNITVMRITK